MTFQVVNHEGSVIVSCATSIDLNLIQGHSELNSRVPECSKLIYSCADDPEKCKYRKMNSSVHRCNNASAREIQPPLEPRVFKTEVIKWKNQVVQESTKKQKCQAQYNIMCSGKKSQETKFLQPVKPPVHMWSVTKLSIPVRKQAHSNKSKVMLQEYARNCQISIMQQVKPQKEMWLPKSAVSYEYRRLCKDQTCQSTRCYKKHSDPKKRQKMQNKVKSHWPVNQEDAILDATSES